jgi:predicted ATPase
MTQLKRLRLQGWKSIKDQTIEFGPLNLVLGANGSGKSNLLSAFSLIRALVEGRLQQHVAFMGGADFLLHFGLKTTQSIEIDCDFLHDEISVQYRLGLASSVSGPLLIANESLHERSASPPEITRMNGFNGYQESALPKRASEGLIAASIVVKIGSTLIPHQFHDTSWTSPMRRAGYIEDNYSLARDGGNLAAMLYRYQEMNPAVFQRITRTIRHIFPRLDTFVLRPQPLHPNNILLQWRELGSDHVFGPHQFSDGTLRAIALVTLLLQPEDDLPPVLILDEPELGLHPYAIGVLAGLLEGASASCQVIVATQSPELISHFSPEDIITADREDRETVFKRHHEDTLSEWLQDYDLGQLWRKNLIGGGPH